MDFIDALLWDPVIKEKKKLRLVQKLYHNKNVEGIWLIVFTPHSHYLLEIMMCTELYRMSSKEKVVVIGLALDYSEALEMVRQLIEQVFRHQGEITKTAIYKEYIGNEMDA